MSDYVLVISPGGAALGVSPSVALAISLEPLPSLGTLFTPMPPTIGAPSSTQFIVPAHPYVQYSDDDDIQAFFAAYNAYAQGYLNAFNAVNLPVYTGLSGPMLDWVAAKLYGMTRPSLAAPSTPEIGPGNTAMFNLLQYDGSIAPTGNAVYVTDDDYFQRIMTWNLYKADGRTFNVAWLKRRVARFLGGVNGWDVVNDQTYGVSVRMSYPLFTITVKKTAASMIFRQAIQAGVLELPFQYQFVVSLQP